MRTLVLGTNLRGLADVARSCLAEGDDVVMFDAESPEPGGDLVGRVQVLPPQWTPEYLSGVDRVITSPWFPEIVPPLSDVLAAGIPVMSEAGFGLERIDSPFVAVTGTNGKTTVTELITTMLNASGVRAVSVGNVGSPVSSSDGADTDIFVVELSSYQLRFLGPAVPTAAALLNVAPDHLDWHGSFEAYAEAKARVFLGMDSDGVLAYNTDDPVVVSLVAEAPSLLVPCSGTHVPPGGNGVSEGQILLSGVAYETPTTDISFLLDLVVAGTVAGAVGASRSGIDDGISSFTAGNHRRQVVPTLDGIVWVDDSKATNPHATSAAVAALSPVVLLAGGQNKGLDLSPIGELSAVTKLILFGEAGSTIQRSANNNTVVVSSLEEAVEIARSTATSGDTVLLSPGCASFDAFSSYAERGDVFQRLVTRTNGAAA